MIDTTFYATMAIAGLAAIGMVTMAMLTGWRGWLQLKQQELTAGPRDEQAPSLPNASARIEIADLKERIRKLEAIAAGVDL
ncbi:MAG: hypothetical protein K2P68_09360 [Sphingomonas sp.]|nr:hypothetical protein [Sphingomonas sp.]